MLGVIIVASTGALTLKVFPNLLRCFSSADLATECLRRKMTQLLSQVRVGRISNP